MKTIINTLTYTLLDLLQNKLKTGMYVTLQILKLSLHTISFRKRKILDLNLLIKTVVGPPNAMHAVIRSNVTREISTNWNKFTYIKLFVGTDESKEIAAEMRTYL